MEKAKNPFDDQKGMFDPRPDFGFRPVFRTINVAQRFVSCAPFIGHIAGFGSRLPDRLFLTLVGAIAPDLRFAAVKQSFNCLAVVDIGWRNIDGMDDLFFAIHANVALHAKIPLVSLFGLMHLGIASLVVILRRRRCGNDRGVDDRAITDFNPLLLEMLIHGSKYLLAYAVLFDEVTELANGCLVRGSFYPEVDTNKFAHCLAIIKAILGLWVRHIEPLLQEVDPQHALNTYGWTTFLTGGIMGFNQAAQFPPWDDGLHLAQKAFTPRLLMVSLKTNASKGHLTHGNLADGLNQIQSDLPRSVD